MTRQAMTTKVKSLRCTPPNLTLNPVNPVIRIWGIHTHAQMDKRLWTAITKNQGRLGSEYRRR